MISVGAGNPYGHPTDPTVADLREHGVPAMRTDQQGEIDIEADGSRWTVASGAPVTFYTDRRATRAAVGPAGRRQGRYEVNLTQRPPGVYQSRRLGAAPGRKAPQTCRLRTARLRHQPAQAGRFTAARALAEMKPAYLIAGDDEAKIARTRGRLRDRAEREGGPGALEVFEAGDGRRSPDVEALVLPRSPRSR